MKPASDFTKLIDDLIPLPGQFLVFNTKEDGGASTARPSGKFLNIFKDKKMAEKVFSVYIRSNKNARSLLREAKILSQNGSHARAVALAIMSYEELGKSQIAADFYCGLLPEEEYRNAFRSHKKTSFTSRHRTIGSHEKNVKYGFWIDDSVAKTLELIRQTALYVDEKNDPAESFGAEDAAFIIKKVHRHIEYIECAEALNERIGSKALFK